LSLINKKRSQQAGKG